VNIQWHQCYFHHITFNNRNINCSEGPPYEVCVSDNVIYLFGYSSNSESLYFSSSVPVSTYINCVYKLFITEEKLKYAYKYI
jgi:hypothetical protein